MCQVLWGLLGQDHATRAPSEPSRWFPRHEPGHCRLVDTGTGQWLAAPTPAPGYHNVAWLLKCPVSAGFLAIKSTTYLISNLSSSEASGSEWCRCEADHWLWVTWTSVPASWISGTCPRTSRPSAPSTQTVTGPSGPSCPRTRRRSMTTTTSPRLAAPQHALGQLTRDTWALGRQRRLGGSTLYLPIISHYYIFRPQIPFPGSNVIKVEEVIVSPPSPLKHAVSQPSFASLPSRHRLSSQTSLEPRPKESRKKKKKTLLSPSYDENSLEQSTQILEKDKPNTKTGKFGATRSRHKKGTL